MKKLPLITGILSLILAVIVFIFADGAKRIYSGGFLAILGIVQLYTAWWSRGQYSDK